MMLLNMEDVEVDQRIRSCKRLTQDAGLHHLWHNGQVLFLSGRDSRRPGLKNRTYGMLRSTTLVTDPEESAIAPVLLPVKSFPNTIKFCAPLAIEMP